VSIAAQTRTGVSDRPQLAALQRTGLLDALPSGATVMLSASAIVAQHGGEIRARTNPGDGATFHVAIPDRV
jgi:hypothetical protein